MIYTTLNKIRVAGPCGLKPDSDGTRTGLCKLMYFLDKTTTDDDPVSFATILESNGLDDALWCLRTVHEESHRWRICAMEFARTVQHLMTDPRSLAALDIAQAHADGRATDAQLAAAGAASWAAAEGAAGAAGAAAEAAWAAAGTAQAAAEAAAGAAGAAGAAARVAARVAAGAAEAAEAASWAAAEAARARMSAIFLECLDAP